MRRFLVELPAVGRHIKSRSEKDLGKIGATGFEPATSRTRMERSSLPEVIAWNGFKLRPTAASGFQEF